MRELDVSYNLVSAQRMLRFLEYLESCGRLTQLNLSWNSLTVDAKRGAEEDGGCGVPLNALDSTRMLCAFVKRQTKLQHLDLSNTHLSERSVHYLIKRLAKHVSLNSVHLSGTLNTLSEKTLEFLYEKLDPIDLRQIKDANQALEPEVTGPPPLKDKAKKMLMQQ